MFPLFRMLMYLHTLTVGLKNIFKIFFFAFLLIVVHLPLLFHMFSTKQVKWIIIVYLNFPSLPPFLFFFETGFLYAFLDWNSFCRPGWSRMHRYPSTCSRFSDFFFFLKKIFASLIKLKHIQTHRDTYNTTHRIKAPSRVAFFSQQWFCDYHMNEFFFKSVKIYKTTSLAI